jgi:hypothetical protein
MQEETNIMENKEFINFFTKKNSCLVVSKESFMLMTFREFIQLIRNAFLFFILSSEIAFDIEPRTVWTAHYYLSLGQKNSSFLLLNLPYSWGEFMSLQQRQPYLAHYAWPCFLLCTWLLLCLAVVYSSFHKSFTVSNFGASLLNVLLLFRTGLLISDLCFFRILTEHCMLMQFPVSYILLSDYFFLNAIL